MSSARIAFALALAVLSAGAAAAQPIPPTVLEVGDPRIDVARLQPYRARWRETIVNMLHQVIERGTWTDELTRETRGERAVLVRRLVVTKPDGTERERYLFVVDARTFEPIRSEWASAGLSYEYDYTGTAVRGSRLNEAGGAPGPIRATLPRLAFDYYAGAMDLMLALVPRTAGARFTFPAALATSGHSADQNGIDWPLVEVFPEETARGAGGAPIIATRVEATTRYGFYKVWVTDSPPYLARVILLIPPGGRITYELLP